MNMRIEAQGRETPPAELSGAETTREIIEALDGYSDLAQAVRWCELEEATAEARINSLDHEIARLQAERQETNAYRFAVSRAKSHMAGRLPVELTDPEN